MASEILLEINGHTYHALRFCYEFYRYTDVKGKPVTGLEGGDIHVVLESNADNSLLETMLSDKSRQVPYHSWPDFEPAPICGKIQLIRDDVEVFRELVFEEGYIYRYHESMTADGYPMSVLLSISTMRLDINRNVRLDRRLLTTYGFGWMKLGNTVFKQAVKLNQSIQPPKKFTTHQEDPVVLVTSVKGESKAIVSQTVQYVVTKYNVPNVKDNDRKRVKWVIEVDGQKEYLKEQGETLDLQIKEEWQGKEIIVMPYLKQATLQVSVKTNIQGLIDVYTQSDKYLFSLEPNNKHKSQKITAKELYKKGIQWFSPTADNYLRLIKKSSNLSQYDELKHFSWEKVIEFAEEDRFMFAYRKGGSGDWKAEGNPGDGFLLVTINGMPYWADAIGQIPFALNEFRNCLKFYGNYKLAEIETLRIGRKFGDGKLFGQSDESNSYDNEMIKRAIKWAKNRYRVVNIDSWNKNAVIKTTNYPPNLLSEPL